MFQKHISQYTDEELAIWVQQIVADESPESMTLEYKEEQDFNAKCRLEIAKDVSAFANARGGVIIYGIPCRPESGKDGEKSIPKSHYGIEPIKDFESRLENAVYENVAPHLPDLWIKKVRSNQQPGQVVYVVWHPESWLSPHAVQSSSGTKYHRRGLKRTMEMTEPEIREAYMRTRRMAELSEQFIGSNDVRYIRPLFGNTSVSQAVSCPGLLVPDRVDFSDSGMKAWLEGNTYPQHHMSRDGSSIRWYPSLYGVQAGMKRVAVAHTAPMTIYYWIELHRNGAITALWETPIERKDETDFLWWRTESGIWGDFLQFCKIFYEEIKYFGPLRFSFDIDRLGGVEVIPSQGERLAAQLPDNTFRTDLIEDSGRVFADPNEMLQVITDRLFQAYGSWKAPPRK